jgi:hypothetical protein
VEGVEAEVDDRVGERDSGEGRGRGDAVWPSGDDGVDGPLEERETVCRCQAVGFIVPASEFGREEEEYGGVWVLPVGGGVPLFLENTVKGRILK